MIQPAVPRTRMEPNSTSGSRICRKANEFVRASVGMYARQYIRRKRYRRPKAVCRAAKKSSTAPAACKTGKNKSCVEKLVGYQADEEGRHHGPDCCGTRGEASLLTGKMQPAHQPRCRA